ncbi:MAG: TadE/TadG family type IV pilus assembly protein, partial [Brevundimonas sp.]
MGLLSSATTRLQAFSSEQAGNIALMFAILLPGLALMTAGAVDLAHVTSSRARLQDVADAAALAAAQELGLAIDDASAVSRAGAFVQSHLASWPNAPTVTPAISVLDLDGRRVIEVHLDGHRPSFFMSLLPPGGWNFSATARATSVGMTPLCVLTTADTKDKVLNVKDSSRLRAPACLVHSNRDILVEGGRIEAAMVQAVTSARGTILPGAGTGAAVIEDPFAGLALDNSRPCSDGNGRQVNIDSG